MTSLANNLAGKFLVVDGPDGAGKSTQLRMLADYLAERQVPLTAARDPGGTIIGDKVRAILLDKAHDEMSPACELMLYMASRAQLVSQIIAPALAAGRCVLCDRYVSSTAAYQGAAGVDVEQILQAAKAAVGTVWPDLTLIVDVPAELGLSRVGRGAAAGPDRMESKSLAFHRRVRELFLEQARRQPAKFAVIDGQASSDDVQARIRAAVETRFGK